MDWIECLPPNKFSDQCKLILFSIRYCINIFLLIIYCTRWTPAPSSLILFPFFIFFLLTFTSHCILSRNSHIYLHHLSLSRDWLYINDQNSEVPTILLLPPSNSPPTPPRPPIWCTPSALSKASCVTGGRHVLTTGHLPFRIPGRFFSLPPLPSTPQAQRPLRGQVCVPCATGRTCGRVGDGREHLPTLL